ncbi:hypothetical protein ACQ4PT_035188 [Festuca glaucescens]
MFERVNVDAIRPQPDGTLGLTVSYAESLWAPANRFSCVNVGGLDRKDHFFFETSHHSLRPGHIFNIGAGKQALKNLNALALFSNIEESIQPGGSVLFELRNICGLNRSLAGSVTSSNLLNPQNLTKQSTFTYGLVMEEITTRDESNDLDQGLGIGSKNPFFNRHQLTVTKFVNLNKQKNGAGKPPPAFLVAHGRYAGSVGDLPSYDAFALGGPHSVRGYGMGELGASRNLLEVKQMKPSVVLGLSVVGDFFSKEVATEVRLPVPMVKNTQVYAFAEHGTDLGSSKDVKGNPTEFFRRAGHGSSYGVGIKLGPLRAEYAVDHNAGTGALFFRYGERF